MSAPGWSSARGSACDWCCKPTGPTFRLVETGGVIAKCHTRCAEKLVKAMEERRAKRPKRDEVGR